MFVPEAKTGPTMAGPAGVGATALQLSVNYTFACDTTEHQYRSHYTVVWQWHTGNIRKNTIHYWQAMPHNTISSVLSVSTAVSLGYVTVWTWHDRTTSKLSIIPGHTTATPHTSFQNTKRPKASHHKHLNCISLECWNVYRNIAMFSIHITT